jgi:hypothetical protein
VGGVHVDTFDHNNSGTAYEDESGRPRAVVHDKTKLHRQPRLPPNCTKKQPGQHDLYRGKLHVDIMMFAHMFGMFTYMVCSQLVRGAHRK